MSQVIDASSIMRTLRGDLDSISTSVETQEASKVIEVGDGIAHVAGLKSAMSGELSRMRDDGLVKFDRRRITLLGNFGL